METYLNILEQFTSLINKIIGEHNLTPDTFKDISNEYYLLLQKYKTSIKLYEPDEILYITKKLKELDEAFKNLSVLYKKFK